MLSVNFIIFFVSFFLLLAAVLGYGFFFIKLLNIKSTILINTGYLGLFGLTFLIIYSYTSNLFLAHNKLHNFIIISIGIIFFLISKKFLTYQFKIKEFFFTFLLFLILFISILITKNHDDFSYYHFQYTYYLTQDSFNFGVGQFNHGFRTPSSIFYLNSLFYLPFIEYFSFNFSTIYILGFANIILINKIGFSIEKLTLLKLNKNFSFIKYLSLISLVFINIFFYRISEHGTDRSAQILIFLLIIEIFDFFLKDKTEQFPLTKIYILFSLIISLKAFYFLYSIFFIPIVFFVFFKKKKIEKTIKYLFFNKITFFTSLILFLVIFSYFSNTGCLLYPLNLTCFNNFNWSILEKDVIMMNDWYELWSKAGANPNFRVSNPEIYIQKFNWVSNWFHDYFFNKVSDFILGLILLILIFVKFFYRQKKKNKINIVNKKYLYFTFFILIFVFFEWFYNHPSLRYGGYCVIALLLFIPMSYFISLNDVTNNSYYKSAVLLFIISIIIFSSRNIVRLNNEINKYQYQPLKYTFYKITEDYFSIQNKMDNLKQEFETCNNNLSCKNLKIKKKYFKYFFIN